MKIPLIIFLFVTLSLPLQAQDELQSWTASDGRVIQAKFIKLNGGSVVIEKDGKPFVVAFTKLSQASVDQAWKLGGRTDPAPKIVAVVWPPPPAPPQIDPSRIRLKGSEAIPPDGIPSQVLKAIEAGNVLQTKNPNP